MQLLFNKMIRIINLPRLLFEKLTKFSQFVTTEWIGQFLLARSEEEVMIDMSKVSNFGWPSNHSSALILYLAEKL